MLPKKMKRSVTTSSLTKCTPFFSIIGFLLVTSLFIAFVSSFHLPIDRKSDVLLTAFGSRRTLTNNRLFAKRRSKERNNRTGNESNETKNNGNNRNIEILEGVPIPANLKRKVQAKRPPLGHIVPMDTRTKGCECFQKIILVLSSFSSKSHYQLKQNLI